jgi:asparagine synthase (glutamine-hydrolysing)
VARLTKENGVKIFLNGQGADEAFGGYHHHFYKYCKSLILKGKIKKYLTEVNKYAELKGWEVNKLHKIVLADVILAAKFKLTLQRNYKSLSEEWNNAKNLSEILRIDLTKSAIPNYLKTDDRNGMAFSIESRHPFMDYRMIELGLSLNEDLLIHNGWQKYIIREAMAEMPKTVRWRKDKKGFTTPQEKWIKEYEKEFKTYLPYLEKINISPKNEFKYYSLAIWLSLNQI